MLGFLKTRTPLWLVAILVVLAVVIAVQVSGGGDISDRQLKGLDKTGLETAKLRAEVRKLQHDSKPLVGGLPLIFTAFTVLIAAGGLMATLRQQTAQRRAEEATRVAERTTARDEHEAELTRHREEREKAREEREAAGRQREEERFIALGKLLASDSPRERVSAVVGIRHFSHTAGYRRRLVLLLGGVLTAEPFQTSDRALAREFVDVMRGCLARGLDVAELDLRGVELRDVDLHDLALTGLNAEGIRLQGARVQGTNLADARLVRADLSGCSGTMSLEGADLTDARLDQAELGGSSLGRARLTRARLDAAKLDGADCGYALFVDAAVTSVHFKGAVLEGADFNGADVTEAVFYGAAFNDHALRTLLNARSKLSRSYFDDATREDLRRLNAGVDPTAPDT
ncbi:MAG: hypothetical protein QOG15_3089 [Solirubrobacteraceae bacterium]|nr:hypothetical protein [Solirubrobacteraceae bacterium]